MAAKILIVDDEPHIRLLIEQALEELEDEGVEMLTAENGDEALTVIQAERPQLVFLDVMMPKVNGLDVCERVRKDMALPDIHVILLTAKGQEYDKQKGLQVGADAYITKPFDPDDLLLMARKLLGLED